MRTCWQPLRAAVPDGVTVIVVPVPDEIRSAYRLDDDLAKMPLVF